MVQRELNSTARLYPRKNAKNRDSSRPKLIESIAGHMIVKNTKFGGLRVS